MFKKINLLYNVSFTRSLHYVSVARQMKKTFPLRISLHL